VSPGPGSAEGFAPARSHILDRLEAERRQALGCFEFTRAEELAAQIRELSAGTAQNPATETTSRPAARRKK
jgi:hypothetical protein